MHALTWAKLEFLKQLVTVDLNLAQGNSPAPAVKEFIHKPIKKKKKKRNRTSVTIMNHVSRKLSDN